MIYSGIFLSTAVALSLAPPRVEAARDSLFIDKSISIVYILLIALSNQGIHLVVVLSVEVAV